MLNFILMSALLGLCSSSTDSSLFLLRSYNFPDHLIGLDINGNPSIVQEQEFFRIVSPGLQGTPGTVSFESIRSPGRYLRHSGFLLHLHAYSNPDDELFQKDATYWPRESRFFPGFTAYESFNYPRYFMRHQGYRLKISTESEYSDLFKKDASFLPLPDLKAFRFQSYNFPAYYIGAGNNRDPRIVPIQEYFRMVSPGLQGTPDTISFQSVKYPGRYLRHSGYLLHLHSYTDVNDELFKKDATYWSRKDRFFSQFTAYESFNFPRYFIRHQGYRLKISTEPNYTDLFKKDASFKPLPDFPIYRFRSYNFPNHYIGMFGQEPRIMNEQELFRLVAPGLQGTPGTVSFESVRFPGRYLRHSGYFLRLHIFSNAGDELFKKDATYWPRINKFFPEFTAFESFNFPNYFIRHSGYRLRISTEDVFSQLLKMDVSFKPLEGYPDTAQISSDWSKCSKTCGEGTKKRRRCHNQECLWEFEACSTGECSAVGCWLKDEKLQNRYESKHECCPLKPLPQDIECGMEKVEDSGKRVVGGHNARDYQWPWMAAVDTNSDMFCAGVIISHRFILSAAHCFAHDSGQPLNSSNWKIVVDVLKLGKAEGTSMEIKKTYIHPEYLYPFSDIALVELVSDITFTDTVKPLCLPGGEVTPEDSTCYVTGWGVSTIPNQRTEHLQQLAITNYDPRVCIHAYKKNGYDKDLPFLKSSSGYLCTGSITKRIDSCAGDSGGPLACQRCNSCSWYLAGIVSFGPDPCAVRGMPGIYTKVVHYEDWILKTTGMKQHLIKCNP